MNLGLGRRHVAVKYESGADSLLKAKSLDSGNLNAGGVPCVPLRGECCPPRSAPFHLNFYFSTNPRPCRAVSIIPKIVGTRTRYRELGPKTLDNLTSSTRQSKLGRVIKRLSEVMLSRARAPP